MALKYTGGGYGGSLSGVPARDLSDEEVTQYGGEEALVKTGLYETSGKKKAEPAAENKQARGGAENKAELRPTAEVEKEG